MPVDLEMHGATALITMNDGKANAVNPTFIAAFNAALDRAAAPDVEAVILTGQPGRFSAGFDLKYFQSEGPEATAALVKEGGRLAHRLFGFEKPLIAAVSGHAIAMGCFLAQCCDARIGIAGDFKIGANETAINMVLPEFAHQLLIARVRPDRLTEAAIFAQLFTPHEAVEVGYLDQVVDPGALMDAATAKAQVLAELPGASYAGNKALVRGKALRVMEESLA
ncbi:MAG: crotonase/enoyl-CoA hydratase family protein [Pseudomonadota bacterium]